MGKNLVVLTPKQTKKSIKEKDHQKQIHAYMES